MYNKDFAETAELFSRVHIHEGQCSKLCFYQLFATLKSSVSILPRVRAYKRDPSMIVGKLGKCVTHSYYDSQYMHF